MNIQSDFVFVALLLIIVIGFLFDQALDFLNARSASQQLPSSIKPFYDESTYKMQQKYDKKKFVVSLFSNSISFVLIIVVLLVGGFEWLHKVVSSISDNEILQTLLFFGIIAFVSEIVSIPIDCYNTFVIEEQFGFNNTTIKTYILDLIKGWLLSLIIGGVLLAFIVYLYQSTASWFWVIAWITVSFFSIFLSYFYTTLLVPVFNKLTPLEEGDLRTAIQVIADKTGFSLKNIFIMDGSKRSSKGNAYFSGFGKKKSIVLFDTLIKNHSIDELVAILTHEIGHYKKKHVLAGLVLGVLQMGLIFYLLSLLLSNASISQAIGIPEPKFYAAVLVFGILLSPLTTLLGIGMNIVSRKNEYEADKYAAKHSNAEALKSALIKLSVKNLSNLTPHPFYVFIHYSHPTLLQRLKALDNSANPLKQ